MVFSLISQLHIVDCRAPRREEAPGLGQRKSKARPGVADAIGVNLLHEARGQSGKQAGLAMWTICLLGQRRLALDIGNGVPQRGKALLAVRGLHGELLYLNKTGTF